MGVCRPGAGEWLICNAFSIAGSSDETDSGSDGLVAKVPGDGSLDISPLGRMS